VGSASATNSGDEALTTAPAGDPAAPRAPGAARALAASVGPLFGSGTGKPHGCTASVISSPHQNLILTAAHCVSGTGDGLLFSPGYLRGASPYGIWRVVQAYVDPAWQAARDPSYDYAVLQVADQVRTGRHVGVEAVTGGNELGLAPLPGAAVTVIAYNQGIDDAPVQCAAVVYRTGGQPSFDCPGFSGGTSGAPWLAKTPTTGQYVVRGLIGGLYQGGCSDATSYSPSFTGAILQLLGRAAADGPADSVAGARFDC